LYRKATASYTIALVEAPAPGRSRQNDAWAFCSALLAGVMIQWLIDPDRAASAAELAKGLRIAAGAASDLGRPRVSIRRANRRRAPYSQ